MRRLDRRRKFALPAAPFFRVLAANGKPDGYLLKRAASRDLRALPALGEPSGASRTRLRARRAKHRQPRVVHGLKWQRRLKASLGARVESGRALQGPFVRQARSMALETQRGAVSWLLTACRAAHARGPAFQLPTVKRNPCVFSALQ